MQPSLEKELRSKIRELEESRKMIGTVILHQIDRKVRECDFLDEEEQKIVYSNYEKLYEDLRRDEE